MNSARFDFAGSDYNTIQDRWELPRFKEFVYLFRLI